MTTDILAADVVHVVERPHAAADDIRPDASCSSGACTRLKVLLRKPYDLHKVQLLCSVKVLISIPKNGAKATQGGLGCSQENFGGTWANFGKVLGNST